MCFVCLFRRPSGCCAPENLSNKFSSRSRLMFRFSAAKQVGSLTRRCFFFFFFFSSSFHSWCAKRRAAEPSGISAVVSRRTWSPDVQSGRILGEEVVGGGRIGRGEREVLRRWSKRRRPPTHLPHPCHVCACVRGRASAAVPAGRQWRSCWRPDCRTSPAP